MYVAYAMWVTSDVLFNLQVTRLGKHINNIRRKTSEKSLARRIRQLLKSWQKLAESSAATHNGLQQTRPLSAPTSPMPPPSCASEPASLNSPSPINTPLSAAVAATAGPEPAATQRRTGSRTDAAYNRETLLLRFSAVRPSPQPNPPPPPPPPPPLVKPSPQPNPPPPPPLVRLSPQSPPPPPLVRPSPQPNPPPLPPPLPSHLPLPSLGVVQPTRSSSPPPPFPLIEDITPVEAITQPETSEDRQLISATAGALDKNGLESCHSCPMDAKSLLVRVPASYHKNESNSFVVSVPRNLVHSAPDGSGVSCMSQSDNPDCVPMETQLSLVVSIDKLCLVSFATNNRVHPFPLDEVERSSPSLKSPVHSTPSSPSSVWLHSVTSPSTGAPSGRLKNPHVYGLPQGSISGVDGCLGQDGIWYSWTDYIPSQGDSDVTVLPYVYWDTL